MVWRVIAGLIPPVFAFITITTSVLTATRCSLTALPSSTITPCSTSRRHHLPSRTISSSPIRQLTRAAPRRTPGCCRRDPIGVSSSSILIINIAMTGRHRRAVVSTIARGPSPKCWTLYELASWLIVMATRAAAAAAATAMLWISAHSFNIRPQWDSQSTNRFEHRLLTRFELYFVGDLLNAFACYTKDGNSYLNSHAGVAKPNIYRSFTIVKFNINNDVYIYVLNILEKFQKHGFGACLAKKQFWRGSAAGVRKITSIQQREEQKTGRQKMSGLNLSYALVMVSI